MVQFAYLKTGDKIARRVTSLKDGLIVREHGTEYTVLSAIRNSTSGSRSVCLSIGDGHADLWLHDLQFTTVEDELARWDTV